VRLRKMELLFIVGPIAIIGAVAFSMADTAKEVGPRLQGQIRQCSGGRVRRGGPRRCIVDVVSHASVEVDVPYGHAGDPVTIVKMQRTISRAAYYAATISGDP
jgi:hypothetical protein